MKETRLGPRWRLAILAILLASTASVPAHAAEGSFERTLAVTGPVELDVSTGSGHINVRAGASSSVHINGTIKAGKSWHLDEAEAKGKFVTSNPILPSSSMVTSFASAALRITNSLVTSPLAMISWCP